MMLKVNYGDMSRAVRRSLLGGRKKETVANKCPGGENCLHPNLLCTECELNDNGK